MRKILIGLVLLLACSTPVLAAGFQPRDLPIPEPGQTQRHKFGDATLTVSLSNDGKKTLTVVAASPRNGQARAILTDDPSINGSAPNIMAVEMDGANKAPEFMLQKFAPGGRIELQFLDIAGGEWHLVQGGSWGGARVAPADLDRDGEMEFQVEDDRFHYAFSCYTCSAGPPRYFKLIDGALADISTSPIFRERDENLMWDMRDACAKDSDLGPDNGACASYVALARRLGRGDEAWKFMLENYNNYSTWGLEYCALVNYEGKCLVGGEFKTYPEALRAFLQRMEEWQPAPPPAQP